ncbi:hypothetical protein A3E67_03695 [Candidatus Daviesbacteria bacterium RIFCSPHIGHO2_12_FULL_38_25]|nr:MAG: hypothetical protein A3E67_03695 [Candidatus Daviesbacteria bacterium RIFCSPHIGHO2_12_FULL_38_25]
MTKELHSDGFCLIKNPSPFGGGFTVTDNLGIVLSRERILKKDFTNNEAELLGVLKACGLSENNGIIITDSMNTIFWIRKGKSKARPDLNEKIKTAKDLIENKKLNLIWKKRDENLAGIYNENYGEEDEF